MIIDDNVVVFQWHVLYCYFIAQIVDLFDRSICGGGTAEIVGIHLFAGVALQTERYQLFNGGDLHCS